MDLIFQDAIIISTYSREEAIADGEIVDATEYIKAIGVETFPVSKIYMTSRVFEDINALEKKSAIDVLCDLIDFGSMEKHDTKLIQHFYLPKERVKITSSFEYDKRILDICYVSED